MGDAEYEHVLGVNLERDRVRKPIDEGSANDRGTAFRTGPNRKRRVGCTHAFDHPRDRADELVPEPGPLLFIPEGRCAKLATCFRMQLDAHDAP